MAAAFAGMAWAAEGRPTLRLGLACEGLDADPTAADGARLAGVLHPNVVEGLTALQPGGGVAPRLARGWAQEPDARMLTFFLRPDARFADGRRADAEAVRASLWRRRGDWRLDALRDLRVRAPDVIELHLHHPDPLLPMRLAEPAFGIRLDAEDGGTGPWRVESLEGARGLLAGRNDHPLRRGRPPARLDLRAFGSVDAQRAALAADDAEDALAALVDVDPVLRAEIAADRRWRLVAESSTSKTLLALNHRHPALASLAARRALARAIDLERLGRLAWGDDGARAIDTHAADSELPSAAEAPAAPDGERTASTPPAPLELLLPPGPAAHRSGAALVAMLGAAGWRVGLRPLDGVAFGRALRDGDFDLAWLRRDDPLDAWSFTAAAHWSGWDAAPLRRLREQHARAARGEPRLQIERRALALLRDEQVAVWLHQPPRLTALRRDHPLAAVWPVDRLQPAPDFAALGAAPPPAPENPR